MFGLTNSYNMDPFQEFENMTRDFWDSGRNEPAFRVDIRDCGNSYELKADLPGMKKEDISLDLDGDYLTISCERHSEAEDKDARKNFIRCERSFGRCSRCFDVSSVDTANIKATFTDGVLKLDMPKKDAVVDTTKHLEIQ